MRIIIRIIVHVISIILLSLFLGRASGWQTFQAFVIRTEMGNANICILCDAVKKVERRVGAHTEFFSKTAELHFQKKIFFTARAVDTVLSRSRVYSFFLIQPFRASLTWLSVGFSATELESGDQRSEFLLLPVHATVRLLKDRLSHSLRGDAFLVGPHIGTVRHRPISFQAFPLMRE